VTVNVAPSFGIVAGNDGAVMRVDDRPDDREAYPEAVRFCRDNRRQMDGGLDLPRAHVVRDEGYRLIDEGVQIDRFLVQRSREARKVRNSASTSACVAVGTMLPNEATQCRLRSLSVLLRARSSWRL